MNANTGTFLIIEKFEGDKFRVDEAIISGSENNTGYQINKIPGYCDLIEYSGVLTIIKTNPARGCYKGLKFRGFGNSDDDTDIMTELDYQFALTRLSGREDPDYFIQTPVNNNFDEIAKTETYNAEIRKARIRQDEQRFYDTHIDTSGILGKYTKPIMKKQPWKN